MKKLFWNFARILVLCLPTVVGGCGAQTETEKQSQDVLVLLPIHSSTNSKLQVVKLQGIKDLKSVSGRYAMFYYAPKLNGSNIMGDKPRARFTKNSVGIFVPQDQTSAEMATVYYHLQNLAELDRSVGLENINPGPRKVAILTRVESDGSWLYDRAYYDLNTDSMLFVEYRGQDLNLTLNAGVIGHEHFHSLFSKLLIRQLTAMGKYSDEFKNPVVVSSEKSDKEQTVSNDALEKFLLRYLLIRSLNEGLADVWGWAFSNDEEFLTKSLPGENDRSLKLRKHNGFFTIPSLKSSLHLLTTFDISVNKMEERIDNDISYRLGSQYANFFRKLMIDEQGRDLTGENKVKFLKSIATFIKGLSDQMVSSEDYLQQIEPLSVIRKFRDMNPDVDRIHCQDFSKLLGGECSP